MSYSEDEITNDHSFDDWFYYYHEFIHPDLKQGREPKPIVADFYSGIYNRIMQAMTPAVRQLAYKHYPALGSETRPRIRQWIDSKIEPIGCCFLIRLFGLLHDERINTNLREKYPDFEKWITQYARPYDHFEILNEIFEDAPWLTEQQKQQMIDEHALEINWKEVRTSEFRATIQELVLEHYHQVEHLSADGWIVYAYLLNSEFADYRFYLEFIAEFIQCGLTEEDLDLTAKEIHDKISLHYQKIYDLESTMNDEEDVQL